MADSNDNWKIVLPVLDIIAAAIKMAPAVLDAYQNARTKINQIISEGRDPTPEEHAQLNDLVNKLRADIHADESNTTTD